MVLSEKELETLFVALNEHFQALIEALGREQRALANRDLDALQHNTAAKQQCCEQIRQLEGQFGDTAIEVHIQQCANPAKLEDLHRSLLAKAREAQDYNAVNGKIIHRAQQSTRELLRLFSNERTEPLYTDTGHPTQRNDGTPIAKA